MANIEMRIWGHELRAGDMIATCTAPGMEVFEAPVATAETELGSYVPYTRVDGTRGSVSADERVWVQRAA